VPEGNTIHRLARQHDRDLAGRIVRVSSPQGRFAREARTLDRRRFRGAEAYGKHLFHSWEGDLFVHVHLGMAGVFRRFQGRRPPPRPTVRMRLVVPHLAIDLIGPPTCELISNDERLAILGRLGPDPLRRDADPDLFWENLQRRPKRPIGDALLDQRVLAGVGNIYRIEALFLIGIHPLRPAGKLTRDDGAALWDTLRRLMRRGVRERTITVDPNEPAHALSKRAVDEDLFYVYGGEVCRRCGGRVAELPLSGRRMFFCPACQPRRRVLAGDRRRPASRSKSVISRTR
jgi:endonuclease-8